MLTLNLICQPLWRQHFDERPSGEQRCVEVRRRPQGEFEVGVILLGGHLLLAGVQRQISEIIHLFAESPDSHFFDRSILYGKNTITVAEEAYGIEALRVPELLIGEL